MTEPKTLNLDYLLFGKKDRRGGWQVIKSVSNDPSFEKTTHQRVLDQFQLEISIRDLGFYLRSGRHTVCVLPYGNDVCIYQLTAEKEVAGNKRPYAQFFVVQIQAKALFKGWAEDFSYYWSLLNSLSDDSAQTDYSDPMLYPFRSPLSDNRIQSNILESGFTIYPSDYWGDIKAYVPLLARCWYWLWIAEKNIIIQDKGFDLVDRLKFCEVLQMLHIEKLEKGIWKKRILSFALDVVTLKSFNIAFVSPEDELYYQPKPQTDKLIRENDVPTPAEETVITLFNYLLSQPDKKMAWQKTRELWAKGHPIFTQAYDKIIYDILIAGRKLSKSQLEEWISKDLADLHTLRMIVEHHDTYLENPSELKEVLDVIRDKKSGELWNIAWKALGSVSYSYTDLFFWYCSDGFTPAHLAEWHSRFLAVPFEMPKAYIQKEWLDLSDEERLQTRTTSFLEARLKQGDKELLNDIIENWSEHKPAFMNTLETLGRKDYTIAKSIYDSMRVESVPDTWCDVLFSHATTHNDLKELLRSDKPKQDYWLWRNYVRYLARQTGDKKTSMFDKAFSIFITLAKEGEYQPDATESIAYITSKISYMMITDQAFIGILDIYHAGESNDDIKHFIDNAIQAGILDTVYARIIKAGHYQTAHDIAKPRIDDEKLAERLVESIIKDTDISNRDQRNVIFDNINTRISALFTDTNTATLSDMISYIKKNPSYWEQTSKITKKMESLLNHPHTDVTEVTSSDKNQPANTLPVKAENLVKDITQTKPHISNSATTHTIHNNLEGDSDLDKGMGTNEKNIQGKRFRTNEEKRRDKRDTIMTVILVLLVVIALIISSGAFDNLFGAL